MEGKDLISNYFRSLNKVVILKMNHAITKYFKEWEERSDHNNIESFDCVGI